MSKLMHNVRAYIFGYLPFYISAYTTLNKLLAVLLYIFAVLLQFERSLNNYFVHNNNYYYYYLQHLAFCYLFNITASLYVGLQIKSTYQISCRWVKKQS